MLRPITLTMLKKRPMSGSEIAEEIEYYIGRRPSPGSIYPLLNLLQKEGLVEPIDDGAPSLKRLKLTPKGLEELEAYKDHEYEVKKLGKRLRKIYWMLFRNMSEDFYDSFEALIGKIESVYSVLDDPEPLKLIIDSTIREIEKMGEKKHE